MKRLTQRNKALLILFTFKDLPRTFYQQDEWMGLGCVLGYDLKILLADFSFLQIISAKSRFLARPLNYLFYGLFPFQIMPFVIFSLVFHILNSMLVFILAQKVSKNILVSAVASIFFATATVLRQAIT